MRNCERQIATPKIILFVFKGMWVCHRQTRRDYAVRACPRRYIFNTTPSHREGAFFCKKISKTGKKGRFIDIDSVFVYCYKYRC